MTSRGGFMGRLPAAISLAAALGLALVSPGRTYGAEPPTAIAKPVVAEAQVFIPPPRGISDITAILNNQKPGNPDKRKRWSKIADGETPRDADRTELARFYMKRGDAARRLGRVGQAIRDLSKANELGAGLSNKKRRKILARLAFAESAGGNRKDSIRHLKQAFAVSKSISFKVRYSSSLARMVSADDGLIKEGETILAQGQAMLDQIRNGSDPRSRRIWRRQGTYLQGRLEFGKGSLLAKQGRYAEAEKVLRASYAKLRASYAKWKASEGKKRGGRGSRLLKNHAQAQLGLVYLSQGRVKEAEIEIRAALLDMIAMNGRDHWHVVRHATYLAKVIRAQGRYREAGALARAALDILDRMGSDPGSKRSMQARVELANALAAQDRWAEALREFDVIKLALINDPSRLEKRIRADPSYVVALLKSGQVADAVATARRAVERYRGKVGEDHPLVAHARGLLAMALSAAGRDREALRLFTRAAPILLARGGGAGGYQPRRVQDRRLRLIQESHMGLLARVHGTALERELGIDAVAEAFRIADTLRGQVVQRALNASAARAAAAVPGSALAPFNDDWSHGAKWATRKVRREQETANRIEALTALYVDLLSKPTDQQNPKARKSLPATIARLQNEHSELMDEIARNFPDYAELMNPKPPTIAEIRASLRPEEALIATYLGDSESYVWAVRKSGPVGFAVLPLGAAKIAAMVKSLRRGLEPAGETLDRVPRFDVKTSHILYEALLAPVAKGWKGAKSLLVVAHGPLGQLPFSVLVTENSVVKDGSGPPFAAYRRVPWLVRSHGVTALPTVSALVTLRTHAPAAWGRRSFAGFADPWFSAAQAAEAKSQAKSGPVLASRGVLGPKTRVLLRALPNPEGRKGMKLANLPRLPETAQEIRSIARALKANLARDVFTGPRSNEHRVKTMELSRYKVIVFASHALMPGNLDGLIQPALAMTAPEIAGIKGDGLLTMSEILGLRLDADWVVLSACNTAAGNGAGAEAISGLGRAFLYAGTRALLLTHWQIESTSARVLVTDLFRRQAADPRLSRSDALRQAKLGLIDGPGFVDGKGKTLYSYAHPAFWAPFALFGEGAATQ